jgi:DmsE family decaheme c-type cytochrome
VCSFKYILFRSGRLKTKKRTTVTKRRAVSITILPSPTRGVHLISVISTLGHRIVSGGGGRSVKSYSRKTVEFGLTEALSTGIPDKPKFRLGKKYLLLAASALVCWAAFGLPQSVKAEDAFAVAGIDSTLPGWSQAAKTQESSQPDRQVADDASFSALSSFAQRIGAEQPKSVSGKTSQGSDRPFDDQAYSALRDFAQRIGAAQPESIKALPKLAEADNLMDWLSQSKQAPAPAAEPAKGPAAKGKRTAAPVEAHFVGDKVCLTCHTSQAAEFQKTLMGRISLTQPGKFACENCHGPGSAHAKAGGGRGVGGILSFETDDPRSAEEKNSICLACHERGDRTLWSSSVHEERGLACVNCHTIMKAVSRKNQLKTAWEPDTCFQCHKDRRAQMFRSSHMPMREGKIVCSDCHNPHGSFTESLLKKDSINDVCYTCHAEKRGPFLFEHAPVRENCANCHDPHGSINEYSLKLPRPRLCMECHNLMAVADGLHHLEGGQGQSCENCHTKIHGTNAPGGSIFGR